MSDPLISALRPRPPASLAASAPPATLTPPLDRLEPPNRSKPPRALAAPALPHGDDKAASALYAAPSANAPSMGASVDVKDLGVRIEGVARAGAGAVQVGVGGALVFAPEPALSKVAGAALVAHGSHEVYAGSEQALSGKSAKYWMEHFGVSHQDAEMAMAMTGVVNLPSLLPRLPHIGKTATLQVLQHQQQLGASVTHTAQVARHAKNWATGNLKRAVDDLGPGVTVSSNANKGKVVYTNAEKTRQIVHDPANGYYRIQDITQSGERAFLDINGKPIPHNIINANGKQQGMDRATFQRLSHFRDG